MKTKISHLFFLAFIALFSLTACQEEITEIDNPTEQETIVANSILSDLMSRATVNDGAIDDILDGTSCFSIELPVTVIVSDITITIENLEDLEQLEDLLDDINDEDDSLDFSFPITIIFNDYTELVIENEDQLLSLINECENEDVDVIECVDFVYPVSFSVFDSEFNLLSTIVIANDEALYEFLENLEEAENVSIASLNYPVTLEYDDGETIEVNSNEELAEAIGVAENYCDDDNDDCDNDSIELALKECQWEIALYSSFPEFQGILLEFNSDYTFDIVLDENQVLSQGNSWSIVSNDTGVFLVLSTSFEDLGGDWQVIECGGDRLEFIKNDENMVIEQECEDDLDCSLTDISDILQECPWDFTDGTDAFDNYQMIFNDNGELQISEGIATSAIGGNWSLSVTDNGIIVTFMELTAFQDTLGGEWLIVECDDNRIEIVREDRMIVLEQNCVENNQDILECYSIYILSQECDEDGDGIATFVFELNNPQVSECLSIYPLVGSTHTTYLDAVNNTNPISLGVADPTELESQILYIRIYSETTQEYAIQELEIEVESCNDDVFNCFDDFELLECVNSAGEAEFNLSADTIGLVNCTESFLASFHITEADAQANIGAISNTELYESNQAEVYLRIEADSGNFEIFIIYLNTEECNLFECFESFDAEIELCDEDNDNVEVFDLTVAFANCTPDADNVTYYETQADANDYVNPIVNPEAYTSISDNQQIYVRVEIDNQFEIFVINLVLQDCSNEGCSEEEVDNFLQTCLWNIVNYNGSDNLLEYNLDFEENSGIVVIYTDTVTIDASWSTSQTVDGVMVTFTNVIGPNIQTITGSWLVVECNEERLELHRGDDILVLERTCN